MLPCIKQYHQSHLVTFPKPLDTRTTWMDLCMLLLHTGTLACQELISNSSMPGQAALVLLPKFYVWPYWGDTL